MKFSDLSFEEQQANISRYYIACISNNSDEIKKFQNNFEYEQDLRHDISRLIGNAVAIGVLKKLGMDMGKEEETSAEDFSNLIMKILLKKIAQEIA